MAKPVCFAVFFVLLSSISSVLSQSSCTTPDGLAGTCVVISSCKSINDLVLDRYRSPAETKKIRDSKCGEQGSLPMVCCENGCTTPDNKPGTCIGLTSCANLNALARLSPVPENVLTYLRQSVCQGTDKNSVCCGSDPPSVTPPKAAKRTNVDADQLLPADGMCGQEVNRDKIIGGTEADLEGFPWLGMVMYRTRTGAFRFGCGSSLINSRYAVTAAHCLAGQILTKIGIPNKVRFGEHDRSNTGKDCQPVIGGEFCNEDPIEIEIENYLPHPDFKDVQAPLYDIGIIRLKSSVPYTDFIRPICLPKSDVTSGLRSGGITFYTAGWGQTDEDLGSKVKLYVTLPLSDTASCQAGHDSDKTRRYKVTISGQTQICAGGEPGKDSCKGDSGGPLMSKKGLTYTMDGVVSFGPYPCAMLGVPGVYTKTHAYLDWIKDQLEP